MNNRSGRNKFPALQFMLHDFGGSSCGEFVWGPERDSLFEKFYAAGDLGSPDFAQRELLEDIMEEDPEFLDAYNSLGWWEVRRQNYGNAKYYFETAFSIGKHVIPKKFDGEIMWGMVDNRPFLRAIYGLGVCHQLTHDNKKAVQLFSKLLKYDKNDSQGARCLAIQSQIALGQFKKVIALCNQYPDDISPDIVYGRVLACHRLSKFQEAKSALRTAIADLPLVAQELVKSTHKEVKSKYPGSIECGGTDEAYEYWERVGSFWADPNLVDFLKEGIRLYSTS